jgi:archaellum component FlaC
MADIFQKLKRKSRKSSSTSSEEDNRPSEEKRSKLDLPEEDREIDEVYSVLEMAEGVLPKLDIVLKKLETMETKLDSLEGYVKNVDAKVNALTTKVETLESTTRNAMKSIEELDKGMAFLNSEVEQLKKLEKDCTALRQEVLYMGVYQRRENLRFYGIEEDPEGAEDRQQVLIDFLQCWIFGQVLIILFLGPFLFVMWPL